MISFLACLVALLLCATEASLNIPSLHTKGLFATPLVNNINDFGSGGGGSASGSDVKGRVLRVAYQGVPGAYSDASTRELLGQNVVAIGRPSFEACFQAVASMECDYACLPVENSLGGSIHENYDLMLRYDLTIVAEHEFRVKHCLLAKPGVKREDIKYAISHPQALAQCDNFLRGLGITPIPTYDTAGSAKMIAEGAELPDRCTPENTAAICSILAGKIYKLNCIDQGIEDDDTNFTRFLLLGRKGVVQHISKKTPAKTSVVFTLPNTPGALYKALACFSLREIDFTKIESRPTSASLLNFLKFRSQQLGQKSRNKSPRFRYCFYLDFLANQLDENTENALAHLREQADFMRILGSYPTKSKLVGPVADAAEQMKHMPLEPQDTTLLKLPSEEQETKPLNIGIIGFGSFGQLLARRMSRKHRISCLDFEDHSKEAQQLGIDYHRAFESSRFLRNLDVVVFSVPLIDFEQTVLSIPADALKGKLVVDTCVLNGHPKSVMLSSFGNFPEIDILTTHPMLSPAHTAGENIYAAPSWDGRPFVYEKTRVSNMARCDQFLEIFSEARCNMIEMNAEQHDSSIADAEFVTHLTGRLLSDNNLLPPTPVTSTEYSALCDVVDMTAGDSFDLFFGMFKFNDRAACYLNKMRDNLAHLERQLAAKDAYLAASAEMRNSDRQRLLAETKMLLREVAKTDFSEDQEVKQKKRKGATKKNEDEKTKQ